MKTDNNDKKQANIIEKIFETVLWNSRLMVLLAVVFGILGSLTVFIVGSLEIVHTIKVALSYSQELHNYDEILIGIIGSIDLFLIGIVLLLFSFGVYELFISRIDIARLHQDIKILDIESLDELKNKILKVIVMVLIVTFFKNSLTMKFTTPLEMLFFAMSIIAISFGVYLLMRHEPSED